MSSSDTHAASRQDLERKLRRSRLLNILLGAVAALAVIVSLVQWSSDSTGETLPGESTGAEQAADDAPDTSSLERRDADDAMAIGAVDAPVVLSEWVDLRCPYCAVYSRDTMPTLVEEYVDEGLVRIEVRDVAFFGDESVRASMAARAAAKQDRYFEFLDAVYDAAPESGHPDLEPDELIEFAKIAGVADMEQFEQDMRSDELRSDVERETSDASALGVTAVPFFVSDGKGMSGAQPLDVFRSFLDDAIDAAE